MQEDLISIRILNKLRDICLAGSPFDLKPCTVHLKQLLKSHADKPSVIIYVLSIFVKQLFHPMQTSAFFAKELHEFIFSHITFNEEYEFIWNIVNYLISNNFDVLGVFERFHNLELLREQSVRILIEQKIQEEQTRTPALKLLCIMLHFVKCKESHLLEEKLEQILSASRMVMSDTDTYLIIYALNKQLEKKNTSECDSSDIHNYQRLYRLIKNSFLDQMFPITCVKYAILLLSSYSRLIQEDSSWDRAACSHFEENLGVKLTHVLAKKLEYSSYISRDIVYVAELSILKAVTITYDNFNKLRTIASANDHTPEFISYLRNNQETWSLCIYLYIKACFTDEDLVSECIKNLEATMNVADDNLKLQIIYGLLDMCNMHLQYYDPLLPHLFEALYSKNSYVRFIAAKMLMRLIGDEQLRLIDGQYFLFMGLLADEKEIVSKNVEVFVREKYVAKYYQTIARYFVPSIIHYNLYYEHPTITLSQSDQDLLKKRIYSWNDRSFIYHCLYEFLSDSLKFNILNQISSEIIMRILNKTIPHSAEIFRILEDALVVILYTVPKNKIDNIEDDRKFYEAELKRIDNDLLVTDLRSNEVNIPVEHGVTLKNLLTSLIQLLYSDISKNPNICQNLLFTIIVFTKTFYASIKRIINEDSTLLKDLYKKLSGFYVDMKHNFVYCLLTVNPCNLETLSEKEDLEFYLHEFKNFHLISPSLILGVEE
ncbi:hypothetical protein ILUMI_01728 [Ignelater luminosus]|uniref:Uncharacterized protein n=1 Tax=Ignelater luminosus TaxID=2038154 RepID=A0A8K0DJL6_IGNLU|nr:hypothetical protein ILUMI_01728 [Ignelater luminosus]